MRISKRQDVEIKEKITGSDLSDRIPRDVWMLLQQSGHKAAERLHDLLHSRSFERLAAGQQAKLIELALTRAYGQPDAPLKREIKMKLSNAGADAVSTALEKLARTATLPEHKTSDQPETHKRDPSNRH